MNILFLCHRFPFPPQRGGKIRPFNTIKHLAEHHRVTVASIARSPQDAADGAGIAAYCAEHVMAQVSRPVQVLRMVARLPLREPSSMGFFYSSALAAQVRALLRAQRFDLIFVHCSSVAQYVDGVQGIPKLLDFGDMDSQKWLEYAHHKPWPLAQGYWLEGQKLRLAERRLARRFDLCTATTRAELQTLDGYGCAQRTGWFPNGVDSQYFSPSPDAFDPDRLCFLGRMDYFPNQQCMLEFCRDVLPLLQARRPALRLDIVGADPSPAVRRLADLPGVQVTGSVPDVRPWLHRAALSVAPLAIARGTQNKILEAMASGIPVVTTPIAAGGVDAVPGEHLLVAQGPQATAEAILAILERPAERQRLAAAGRLRMLSHHSWPSAMRRLDALLEQQLGLELGQVSGGAAQEIAA